MYVVVFDVVQWLTRLQITYIFNLSDTAMCFAPPPLGGLHVSFTNYVPKTKSFKRSRKQTCAVFQKTHLFQHNWKESGSIYVDDFQLAAARGTFSPPITSTNWLMSYRIRTRICRICHSCFRQYKMSPRNSTDMSVLFEHRANQFYTRRVHMSLCMSKTNSLR